MCSCSWDTFPEIPCSTMPHTAVSSYTAFIYSSKTADYKSTDISFPYQPVPLNTLGNRQIPSLDSTQKSSIPLWNEEQQGQSKENSEILRACNGLCVPLNTLGNRQKPSLDSTQKSSIPLWNAEKQGPSKENTEIFEPPNSNHRWAGAQQQNSRFGAPTFLCKY